MIIVINLLHINVSCNHKMFKGTRILRLYLTKSGKTSIITDYFSGNEKRGILVDGKTIKIGVIGYGVVGRGTVESLIGNAAVIRDKTGLDIVVKGIADLNIDRKNDEYTDLVEIKTKNADDLINDPEIDIIAELIGGYGAAKKFITGAINKGKHVVTANKALLAVHGREIFGLAEEKGVSLGFEASVGGGIPIIRVMKEDLAANNIQEIYGIINGTANYILTRMTKEGKAFDEVLRDAQEKGYAEADPTFDVEGIDTAHKICLLSSIAFSAVIPFDKIFVEGISNIKPVDIEIAKELGCTIKLLAIAKKDDSGMEVRVHPTIIPDSNMLSSVDGVFNAVCLTGDKVGTTMHYGRGAGGSATGSAVAGDIINIARNIAAGCGSRVPVLGFVKGSELSGLRSIEDITSCFYMRLMVVDAPGVLAKVGGILASNGISVSSALQREKEQGGEYVPLVFMTHETKGHNIMAAAEEIDELDVTVEKSVVIRVEGER